MKGERKRYDAGGVDLGNGKPAPADTVLNLYDDEAERLGLKTKASRSAAGDVSTKPRPVTAETAKKASTRKRTASPTRKRAAKR